VKVPVVDSSVNTVCAVTVRPLVKPTILLASEELEFSKSESRYIEPPVVVTSALTKMPASAWMLNMLKTDVAVINVTVVSSRVASTDRVPVIPLLLTFDMVPTVVVAQLEPPIVTPAAVT
jgi:hypothetical protein